MKKSIGILGGMGPLATADLFRKIVLLTDAARDNDHIRIYIDDNASIPDRTAAILSGGADPLPAMTDSLRKLEACGADCIIMPCNTAHYFLPRLQTLTAVPFLSMLEATARACAARFPGGTAAVLATKGTLSAGLYQAALEQAGAVEDVGHHQTDDAGNGGGAQEECHSLPAHSAHLLHVIHGQDTVDHGEQHHGDHDELQQVDEDGAKGLQVVGGEVRRAGKVADQADDDAQNQGDQDLHGETRFFLHTFTSYSFFSYFTSHFITAVWHSCV